MTAQEIEQMFADLGYSNAAAPVTVGALARVLARMEQQPPGAAGEHQSNAEEIAKMMRSDLRPAPPQPPAPPAIKIKPRCEHDHLNEDGQCRRCGADCRGIAPPAPPAAPEAGKSVNILSYQIVQDVLEREGLAVLIERFGKAIDAERAAAAGEARRRALEEAAKYIELVHIDHLTRGSLAKTIRCLPPLDAAAAPAGEGSGT